jgi:hypothetical protein
MFLHMHLPAIDRVALRVAAALVIWPIAFAQSTSSPAQTAGASGQASPGFDGKWLTTLTCPPKGSTEGYTWQFSSVIQNSSFRGEHGTAGEPGYLLLEGKVAGDGSAKLAATGIVASRKYARGVFAHKGEQYTYDVKAQFERTKGTGIRSEGLGIAGRPCTFGFVKQTVP